MSDKFVLYENPDKSFTVFWNDGGIELIKPNDECLGYKHISTKIKPGIHKDCQRANNAGKKAENIVSAYVKTVIIVMLVLILILVMIPIVERVRCSNIDELNTKIETTYKFMDGCYVKINGIYVQKNSVEWMNIININGLDH